MQTPAELRTLAAHHRIVPTTAVAETQAWRLRLADYLEALADETERTQKPAIDQPMAFVR